MSDEIGFYFYFFILSVLEVLDLEFSRDGMYHVPMFTMNL